MRQAGRTTAARSEQEFGVEHQRASAAPCRTSRQSPHTRRSSTRLRRGGSQGWLIEVAESLAEFPNRGRGAGLGRRKMTTVGPIPALSRGEDGVIILHIRHGARDEGLLP